MADIIDVTTGLLAEIFGSRTKAIVSDAPGAGPRSLGQDQVEQAEHAHFTGQRPPLGFGQLPTNPPGRGTDAIGYGGAGDPVIVDTKTDVEVEQAIAEAIRLTKQKRLRDVNPRGRIRLGKWFWLEGHTDETVGPVMGPWSLFDGTIAAPSAGNSVQQVPITLPPGTISPVFLLDRYPGAMYLSLYIRSFAFVPTGTTGTGLQECWFTDYGGAVAGLGIYNAASEGNDYESINCQMSSPLNDPGTAQLGTLNVNNIGIAGTPTSVRYQLTIGYMAFIADPWFNEQMIVGPTPAELAEGLRSMEAQ